MQVQTDRQLRTGAAGLGTGLKRAWAQREGDVGQP